MNTARDEIDKMVLDKKGKHVLSKIRPLAFDLIRSEYAAPGTVVGKAFCAGKKHLS